MTIIRGDEFPLYFRVKNGDSYLTHDEVSEIIMCIEKVITKKYSAGEILPDMDDFYTFKVQLTQEETFKLQCQGYKMMFRTQNTNGDIIANYVEIVYVKDTLNEDILP